MLDVNRRSPPRFFLRLREGCAAVACLFFSGLFLACSSTTEGIAAPGTVCRSSRPVDADPSFAEQVGRAALAKVGYLPILRLARQAGWVTVEKIERVSSRDPALLAMGGAGGFIEVFSKYAVAAGVASQADTPVPGPGDALAVGIVVIGLIDAGLLAGALLDSMEDAVSPAPSATTEAPPAVPMTPVASSAPTVTVPPVATTAPIAGAETEKEARCAEEWDDAIKQCKELLNSRNPPRGVTGGYLSARECARGLVSEDCGGNSVDWEPRPKRRRGKK